MKTITLTEWNALPSERKCLKNDVTCLDDAAVLVVSKTLAGHVSPETAYVVQDYPYGYTLRCKKRYWLEYRKAYGYRLVTQTTNPKHTGEHWNSPKAGNYSPLAVMVLNEDGHVTIDTLRIGATEERIASFEQIHGAALDDQHKATIKMFRAYLRKFEPAAAA